MQKLRSDSSITLCVVGNCQAQSLEAWIASDAPTVHIERIPPVWLLTEADIPAVDEKLERADLVFSQRLSDDFPIEILRPNSLRQRFEINLHTWPNMYFDGYFPGVGYRYRLDGSKITGPLDEYHFDFILSEYKKGATVDAIASMIEGDGIFEYHVDPITASIARLIERETDVDVIFSDWICQNIGGPQMFFAMNHPVNAALREMMNRLFSAAGISDRLERWTEFAYPLNKIVMPVLGGIRARHNLQSILPPNEFKGVEIELADGSWRSSEIAKIYSPIALVEHFFRVYDMVPEFAV